MSSERAPDLTLAAMPATLTVSRECGCTLSRDALVVTFTYCEAHAKVKTVKRNPNWSATAAAAVASVARRLSRFTTDDVWAELGPDGASGGDPRSMGGVMSAAEKAGLCAQTSESQTSTRRECHGRPVRVWQSRVARGCIAAVK